MGDDIVLSSIVVLALVAWVSYLVRNEGRRHAGCGCGASDE